MAPLLECWIANTLCRQGPIDPTTHSLCYVQLLVESPLATSTRLYNERVRRQDVNGRLSGTMAHPRGLSEETPNS